MGYEQNMRFVAMVEHGSREVARVQCLCSSFRICACTVRIVFMAFPHVKVGMLTTHGCRTLQKITSQFSWQLDPMTIVQTFKNSVPLTVRMVHMMGFFGMLKVN